MRTSALLPALLVAASANAQSATFTLTLTSAAGGADTLATWNLGGTPTIGEAAAFTNINISGLVFASGNTSAIGYSISGSAGKAFTGSLTTVTGLSTGLVLTNTTTNATVEFTKVSFATDATSAAVIFGFPVSFINAAPGEMLELSGPATGSFLLGAAYANFQEGSWTLDQAVYTNFDPVLTVGTPVPEPSAYGLMLGGLALVGAAIRRRKNSK